MAGFDEYAAVARELSARRRGGEQAVAAETERRRTLAAAVEQLGQRLTAQGQRLDQLGQAIGVDAAERPAASAVPPEDRADDPAGELAAAGQLADSADRHGQEAEALAHRPALLPTWSSLARAVAVYAACALAGGVLLLFAAVSPATQALGLGLVLAAMCTGVPVAGFLAGYVILGRWGSPVIDGPVPTSRYVPLGFVLCALLSPTLYCAYVLAFRLLR